MNHLISLISIDESSQDATEYVLMLVIVVAVVILFKNQFLDVIKGKILKL